LDFQDLPGISFAADGSPLRAERDQHAAAMSVLGHDVTAPAPGGDINTDYPAIGAAQMDIAVEALAKAKTCAVTLQWGDEVTLKAAGLTVDVHTASDYTSDLYNAIYSASSAPPGNMFITVQNWNAQQFASLLDRLAATPLGSGTLMDRSVVVGVSDSGEGFDRQ